MHTCMYLAYLEDVAITKGLCSGEFVSVAIPPSLIAIDTHHHPCSFFSPSCGCSSCCCCRRWRMWMEVSQLPTGLLPFYKKALIQGSGGLKLALTMEAVRRAGRRRRRHVSSPKTERGGGGAASSLFTYLPSIFPITFIYTRHGR